MYGHPGSDDSSIASDDDDGVVDDCFPDLLRGVRSDLAERMPRDDDFKVSLLMARKRGRQDGEVAGEYWAHAVSSLAKEFMNINLQSLSFTATISE